MTAEGWCCLALARAVNQQVAQSAAKPGAFAGLTALVRPLPAPATVPTHARSLQALSSRREALRQTKGHASAERALQAAAQQLDDAERGWAQHADDAAASERAVRLEAAVKGHEAECAVAERACVEVRCQELQEQLTQVQEDVQALRRVRPVRLELAMSLGPSTPHDSTVVCPYRPFHCHQDTQFSKSRPLCRCYSVSASRRESGALRITHSCSDCRVHLWLRKGSRGPPTRWWPRLRRPQMPTLRRCKEL